MTCSTVAGRTRGGSRPPPSRTSSSTSQARRSPSAVVAAADEPGPAGGVVEAGEEGEGAHVNRWAVTVGGGGRAPRRPPVTAVSPTRKVRVSTPSRRATQAASDTKTDRARRWGEARRAKTRPAAVAVSSWPNTTWQVTRAAEAGQARGLRYPYPIVCWVSTEKRKADRKPAHWPGPASQPETQAGRDRPSTCHRDAQRVKVDR